MKYQEKWHNLTFLEEQEELKHRHYESNELKVIFRSTNKLQTCFIQAAQYSFAWLFLLPCCLFLTSPGMCEGAKVLLCIPLQQPRATPLSRLIMAFQKMEHLLCAIFTFLIPSPVLSSGGLNYHKDILSEAPRKIQKPVWQHKILGILPSRSVFSGATRSENMWMRK